MKIDKDWARLVIQEALPLAVGACASSVISKALGAVLPEPEKLTERAVRKVGCYGIGLLVSNKVLGVTKTEVKALTDPVLDVIFGLDPVEEPEKMDTDKVTKESIKSKLDEGKVMIYDPNKDELTFKED